MADISDTQSMSAEAVAILKDLPDGFALLGPDGRIRWMNSAAQALLDCAPGDVAWEKLPEIFAPECCLAWAEKHVVTLEKHLPLSNRWQEIRVSPWADGLCAAFRDITERKRAEAATQANEARLRAIYEHSRDAIGVSMQGVHVSVNPAYLALFGYSRAEELLGVSVLDLVAPSARAAMRERIQRRAEGNPMGAAFESRCLRADGTEFDAAYHVSVFEQESDVYTLAILRDVTERNRAEVALRQAETRYRSIFENAREGLFQTSPAGRLLAANPATAEIFGYDSPEEMLEAITDMAAQVYVDPARRADLTSLLARHGSVMDFESELRRKGGQAVWISSNVRAIHDENGALSHYEGSVIEITQRKAAEAERTRRQAHTEGRLSEALQQADLCPLTGLRNHRAFHQRLGEEADAALASGRQLAVAVLDMDNFKFFNDSYGHLAGDDVLRQVADALRAHCRASDTLARLGGDEFALLMPGLGAAEAAEVAARLMQSLDSAGYRPPGDDSAIPLRLSAGIAVFPDEGKSGLCAFDLADERLLRSKQGTPADAVAEQLRVGLRNRWEGFSILDALVTAVDTKDRCTRRHSEEVAAGCLRAARQMGWDESALQTMALAALLHDVGKIGIPDRILRKPGPLTEEQLRAMRRHPQMGAAIVGASPDFEALPKIIRHHHEHWDGGGYPDGLRGEAIPLLSRLLAIAEAYSAMMGDRPFRKGLPAEQAQALLIEGAGTQWNPICVQAFLESLEQEK